jgi:tetratricopeptide (TPR) repeat protein
MAIRNFFNPKMLIIMISRLRRKAAVATVVSLMFAAALAAQERNDVVQAYNEGAKAIQTDPAAAIKSFENAIALAEKVGETAADLKQKATSVLPGLYLKVAANTFAEKKPVEDIMKTARTASAIAAKHGTQAHKDNASKIMVQAYGALATAYFNKNDYPGALSTFDSLLAINPDYQFAIYNKALIYLRTSNNDLFEKTIDLYLEKVKPANEEAKIKQASTLALEYFRGAGSKANQADKTDDALALLNKAAKYGDDKDLFYYFADVLSKKKDFDKALEYAQRGLDMETGAPEAKAKFYFQLGLAQEGKGMTTEACGSFKNAAFGPFAEPSKAKMKNLKCQ